MNFTELYSSIICLLLDIGVNRIFTRIMAEILFYQLILCISWVEVVRTISLKENNIQSEIDNEVPEIHHARKRA